MKTSERPVQGCFQFGPFRLNPAKRMLLHGLERVALPSKAFDILLVLVENRGRVVEKGALMQLAWPDTAVEENNLTKSIAAIRKALGDQAGESEYISTIPGRGYSFVGDVSEALPEPAARPPLIFPVVTGGASHAWRPVWLRRWAPSIFGALLLLGSIGIALLRPAAPAGRGRVRRFALMLPEGARNFTLSPDGETLEYTTAGELPEARIYRFQTGESKRIELPVRYPAEPSFANPFFWSADGRWMGFVGIWGNYLKLDTATGQITKATLKANSRSGASAWGPDGSILCDSGGAGIARVLEVGGEPRQLTRITPPDREHVCIQSLPDGRHFLFFATRQGGGEIRLGSLEGKPAVTLLKADSAAIYADPGYLLYAKSDSLVAQRFDNARNVLSGPAQPLIDSVARSPWYRPEVSVSHAGVLIYRPGSQFPESRMTWFDRSGARLNTLGRPGVYSDPVISPDGSRLAVGIFNRSSRNRDVWLFDLIRGGSTQMTFDPADDAYPVWSPDGSQIAFTSNRTGNPEIYLKNTSGTAPEQLLPAPGAEKRVQGWSPNGALLAFDARQETRSNANPLWTGSRIWFMPVSGSERQARALHPGTDPPGSERQCRFSPDGNFVAYAFGSEVFVDGLGSGGRRWQISTQGGGEPQWRADGKELFFVSHDTLMAVDIKTAGKSLVAGIPQALFKTPPSRPIIRNRYAAAPDGQRFLLTIPENEAPAPPVVIENWQSLLGK